MSIKCMTWAWERDLRAADKLVLLALADHADDTGYCWPGSKGIAEKCGISRRTFFKSLNAMKDAALLSIESRHDDDGRQLSNSYLLHITDSARGCEHGFTGEGATIFTGRVQPGRHEPSIEPSGDAPVVPSSVPTEPSSVTPGVREKRKTEITESFVDQMVTKWVDLGTAKEINEHINDAVGHSAYRKWDNKQRYVDKWLRRAAESRAPPSSARPPQGRSRRAALLSPEEMPSEF